MRHSIYISGPISNNPNYIESFAKAHMYLESLNIFTEVINPANNIDEDTGWTDAMESNIDALFYLHGTNVGMTIYLLKGWEDSAGSRIELAIAKNLDFDIIYEEQESGGGI
ncbi:MAG: DUF4406 domain-containing protein [Chloroherpetonaceae bacterium]|jgi:hypothetical protein